MATNSRTRACCYQVVVAKCGDLVVTTAPGMAPTIATTVLVCADQALEAIAIAGEKALAGRVSGASAAHLTGIAGLRMPRTICSLSGILERLRTHPRMSVSTQSMNSLQRTLTSSGRSLSKRFSESLYMQTSGVRSQRPRLLQQLSHHSDRATFSTQQQSLGRSKPLRCLTQM